MLILLRVHGMIFYNGTISISDAPFCVPEVFVLPEIFPVIVLDSCFRFPGADYYIGDNRFITRIQDPGLLPEKTLYIESELSPVKLSIC